jgi:mono/diheme cytochrome c family protein
MAATVGSVGAQGVDLGKQEYVANCAGCHGVSGKGDGIYQAYLTRTAPDLTRLAKASGGVFPFQRVYQVIDGRTEVGAHGTRDMPIWGTDYLQKASRDPSLTTVLDQELFVRARIMALIDYLNQLQQP